MSKRPPNWYYTALGIVLMIGGAIFVIGMCFNAAQYCYGGAVCTYFKRLEWETLCAGLFGLTGGLAVIAISKDQFAEARENIIKERLFDVDFLIRRIEHSFEEMKSAHKIAATKIRPEDELSAHQANSTIESAAINLPKAILDKLEQQQMLPQSLINAARHSMMFIYPGFTKTYSETEHFNSKGHVEMATNSAEIRIRYAELALKDLVNERNKYAAILRKI